MKEIVKKFTFKRFYYEIIKSGMLFYFLFQILLNGWDKVSLENIKIGIENKLVKKFKRKYKHIFNETKQAYKMENIEVKDIQKKIWILWIQGFEDAPEIVKMCVESTKRAFKDYEIILLNIESVYEYIEIPEIINQKWKKGYISNAHLSDVIRTELLIKYGGIWIDATVFFTDSFTSKNILESELFFFQKLKPGKSGSKVFISNWFIVSKPNNLILLTLRNMLIEYWKNFNYPINYFIYHILASVCFDFYSEEYEEIPKFNNSSPHVLLLELYDRYNEERFNDIKKISEIHKLSYKYMPNMIEGTYLDKILKDEGNINNRKEYKSV